MSNEYITVKQAATAAGVTTQRIYQLLAKDLQQYCKVDNGKKYVNIKLLEHFKTEDLQSTCKAFANDYQEQNDKLRAEVDAMREQIASKDREIDRLQNTVDLLKAQLTEAKADKEYFKSKLDAADTNISNLTAALQAAQALHGIDKKQSVIEMAAAEAQTSPEAAEDPKQSFFARLFKRK